MVNEKKIAIILATIIILDSIVSAYMGTEVNPLIFWSMNKFDLTLNQAMFWRIAWCLPLVYLVYKYRKALLVLNLYLTIYVSLAGIQFFHYFMI